MLDPQIIDKAFIESARAEVFFSVGTSAVVQPAASLPMTAKQNGATLVEVNPERTPISDLADFYFQAKSGEFLPELMAALKKG
jgi:NAD-dependent deacetylase